MIVYTTTSCLYTMSSYNKQIQSDTSRFHDLLPGGLCVRLGDPQQEMNLHTKNIQNH